MMISKPLVYIVDNQPNDYEMYQRVVSSAGYIPVLCNTLHTLFETFQSNFPSCIVLRSRDSGQAVIEDLKQLKALYPDSQVVIIGANWALSEVVTAVKLGAVDVLETPADESLLGSVVTQAVTIDAARRNQREQVIPPMFVEKLNRDEAMLLELMIKGLTTKQMRAKLDVSVRTIHYRKKSMLKKLGVEDRSEMMAMVHSANGRRYSA